MEYNHQEDYANIEPTTDNWIDCIYQSESTYRGVPQGDHSTMSYPTSPVESPVTATSTYATFSYIYPDGFYPLPSSTRVPQDPGYLADFSQSSRSPGTPSWQYSPQQVTQNPQMSGYSSANEQKVAHTPKLTIDTFVHPLAAVPPLTRGPEWDALSSKIYTDGRFFTTPIEKDHTSIPSDVPAASEVLRTCTTIAQRAKEFREFPLRAVTPIRRGAFLPQKMYRPHTNADKERYVNKATLQDDIVFESSFHHEWGISLIDALSEKQITHKLKDPGDLMFEGLGPSVSIRLEWPGYGSWSRQIPTKDFKNPPGPITRQKLVKNVTKCIQRFMKESATRQTDEDADPNWRVGNIRIEELMLVSLHHVSMGSWQPHIRLKIPRALLIPH